MSVEPWDPGRHHETYRRWMAFYDVPALEVAELPPTGFVVEGLAMGFLLRTDAKVAMIELLLGNPWLPRPQVDAALDEVVLAAITTARAEGFTMLQGTTEFQAVVERALRLGFELDPSRYQVVRFSLS